jgi:hypothetical protein
MFDDHDQIREGNNKARFCADARADRQVLSALALRRGCQYVRQIAPRLHRTGDNLRRLSSTNIAGVDQTVAVEARNGKAV